MNTLPVIHFLYMSAAKDGTTETNYARANRLGERLREEGYHPYIMIGKYKGLLERSFMIVAPESVEGLLAIAKEFEQETILTVDSNRIAWLVNVDDGTDTLLGAWVNLRPDFDKWDTVDYTLDPRTGRYYGIAA